MQTRGLMTENPLVVRLEAYLPLSDSTKEAVWSLLEGPCAEVAPKRNIVSQGTATSTVAVLMEGLAARYDTAINGERHFTGWLIAGDFCNLYAARVAAPLDQGVVAITRCLVAHLEGEALERLRRERADLDDALAWIALSDHAQLRHRVISTRLNAQTRVGHLLCELHTRIAAAGMGEGNGLRVPLSQSDLAEAVGLTPVHMNRVVRELRDQGLLARTRRGIEVPDAAALAKASGYDPAYLHLRKV